MFITVIESTPQWMMDEENVIYPSIMGYYSSTKIRTQNSCKGDGGCQELRVV